MIYIIRKYTKQDYSFLWEMLYQSLYVPAGQEPFAKTILDEPYIKKYLENWGAEGDIAFIATDLNDIPIGSITCRFFSKENAGFGFVNEQTPELGMAINRNFRGLGIGTALLAHLFQYLKEKQIEQVSLSVDPSNIQAVDLYKKFNFELVGQVGTSLTMVAKTHSYE